METSQISDSSDNVNDDESDYSDDVNVDETNSSDEEFDDTHYDSEDEVFPESVPANLSPIPGQNVPPGQPIELDINSNREQSSNMPLCLLFNSRSIYNKSDNLREMLRQIGPDITIVSETFERERKRITREFKCIYTIAKIEQQVVGVQ